MTCISPHSYDQNAVPLFNNSFSVPEHVEIHYLHSERFRSRKIGIQISKNAITQIFRNTSLINMISRYHCRLSFICVDAFLTTNEMSVYNFV